MDKASLVRLSEGQFRRLTGLKRPIFADMIRVLHASQRRRKGGKRNPLTPQQKVYNRMLASQRTAIENIIRFLKRFRIIADRYRNRRKRFGLRFNLIEDIYNYAGGLILKGCGGCKENATMHPMSRI